MLPNYKDGVLAATPFSLVLWVTKLPCQFPIVLLGVLFTLPHYMKAVYQKPRTPARAGLVVRLVGVEPTRLSPLVPKTSVSPKFHHNRLMGLTGLEPVRTFVPLLLRQARLPISPQPRGLYVPPIRA